MTSGSLQPEETDATAESTPDASQPEPPAPETTNIEATGEASASQVTPADPSVEAAPEPAPEPVPASEPAEPAAAAVTAAAAPEPASPPAAALAAPAAAAVEPAPPASPPAPPSAWQAPVEATGPFPGVKFPDHAKRLFSYILDVIIAAFLTIVVAIGLGILTAIFAAAGLGILAFLSGISLFLAIFLVSVVYWPYFWVKSGTTPGMRIVGGLRVVMDRDGGPVTLGPAILRLIGYWIDALVFYLGFAWILIDSRRRGWHDLIAGTVVIQDE
jgi:uncharacterized RDD family membrane protein YckC